MALRRSSKAKAKSAARQADAYRAEIARALECHSRGVTTDEQDEELRTVIAQPCPYGVVRVLVSTTAPELRSVNGIPVEAHEALARGVFHVRCSAPDGEQDHAYLLPREVWA